MSSTRPPDPAGTLGANGQPDAGAWWGYGGAESRVSPSQVFCFFLGHPVLDVAAPRISHDAQVPDSGTVPPATLT